MMNSSVRRTETAATQYALQGRRRSFRKTMFPWIFILPILLLHLFVVAGPSLAAIYYSLTDWKGLGAAHFVGLANYHRLFFEDTAFRTAFGNNVLWLIIFLTIPFILALLASSLLAPVKRGSMFYRTVLFIPYVLPSVITASIWSNLLSPTLGIGAQLAKIGIPGLDQAFLGKPTTALPTIAFVDNWHWWGFLMVLLLAAMQNSPPELYEAARIDGANRWQELRYITLPGIRPTLVFLLLMTAIWSFLVFDYVYLLTQGGPAGASEVLGTLVYKNALHRFDAGYAAAMGLTMSAFAGVIVGIFGLLRRRGWEI
jgi:raffinose/stachyose/melibiose transport system permease protein